MSFHVDNDYDLDQDQEDEDLRRAIAASLLEAAPEKKAVAEVIDLISDDEEDDDDDLDRPPRYKKELDTDVNSSGLMEPVSNGNNQPQAVQESKNIHQASITRVDYPSQITSAVSGLLGFDRKKMEEERLARTKKRKASISPPPPKGGNGPYSVGMVPLSSRVSKPERPMMKKAMIHAEPSLATNHPEAQEATFSVPTHLMKSKPLTIDEIESEVSIPLLKSKPVTVANQPTSMSKLHQTASKTGSRGVISYQQQQNLLAPGIHFPDGIVKKTWAYGFPRINDIKIEEVLQVDDLELAVLSSFQWNDEWILSKLNKNKNLKIVCVVQADTEESKASMRENAPSNIRLCFPSMAGQINCMHSKLQLLSHPTHLRVVVPSANLVPYDWGETGIMENTVFMIDLPRHPDGPQPVDMLTNFGLELQRFLKAMDMMPAVIDSLLKFDFSRTADLAFVHTIGGSHSGDSWKVTGYPGLGRAINKLGMATKAVVEVDLVSSSVGSLNNEFLKTIYLATKGDDGMTEYQWRTKKPPGSKKTSGQTTLFGGQSTPKESEESRLQKELDNNFKIYYPTHETVSSSKGGIGSGGTICMQPRWYDSDKFPRHLMRDCKSERTGMLMHSKIIFTRFTPGLTVKDNNEGGNAQSYVGWAYVGSANLSESAWGRLVCDQKTKLPKLNCRNWECGVVLPVRCDPGRKEEALDIIRERVPVPMLVPGEVYGARRPWFNTR